MSLHNILPTEKRSQYTDTAIFWGSDQRVSYIPCSSGTPVLTGALKRAKRDMRGDTDLVLSSLFPNGIILVVLHESTSSYLYGCS